MYNKLLDTFKAVADYGSFSKAANELFITHTALIKQINSLEEYLGVKLFNRTHHGTSLTPAGQVLYSETLELIKTSDKIIFQVQETHFAYPKIFLIGTSTLYPCQVFMELWNQIVKEHPDYQLKIVSFNNDAHRLTLLNDAFDFVVGPYNNPSESKDFVFIPLGSYRFTLSLNRNHYLAHKKSISFQDLSQENIMIMKPGISPINDEIRNKIISQYPDINIIDINPYYDISTFNHCAENQDILLSLECWKNIHPSLVTIPLKEKFYLPYGIVIAKKHIHKMQEFIQNIEKIINSKKS